MEGINLTQGKGERPWDRKTRLLMHDWDVKMKDRKKWGKGKSIDNWEERTRVKTGR